MAKATSNKAAMDAAAKTIDAVAAAGKETVENIVKTGTENATKGYEKAFAFGKEQADAAAKGYDQVATFGKENVEAAVEAGTVATKGVEEINAEIVDYAKTAMADQMAVFGKLMAAKSPQEVIEMQTEFAKTSFDAMVARTTKIGEMSTKLANDAFAPVTARTNVAMETFVKPFVS